MSDDYKDVFIAIDQPGQFINELNIDFVFAKRAKAVEDQHRRPEGRTPVVRERVCKSKLWNRRWDAQGAGVECKTERKLEVKVYLISMDRSLQRNYC